jgi:hypothetical protein
MEATAAGSLSRRTTGRLARARTVARSSSSSPEHPHRISSAGIGVLAPPLPRARFTGAAHYRRVHHNVW